MPVVLLSLALISFGRSQFNTTSAQNGGDYPFINLMKGSQGWSYNGTPTDPNAPPNQPIAELDADGYITSVVAGTTGVFTVFQFPNNSQYSGNWVLKWDGNGTLSVNGMTASTVSGSLDNSAGGAGRYVFTRTDNGNTTGGPGLSVTAVNASPNYVRNISLCKAANEAAMDAGQQFDPTSLALIKSAKPGVIRSLGWGGQFSGTNNSFLALWAQRMPKTYVSYGSPYNNPAFYGGRTTNSGSDYTLSYPSFSLTNKVCVTVLFNATAPQSASTAITINTASGAAINITWASHGLVAGNTVAFGNNSSPPAPLVSATTYFVKTVVDANTFTVSATSGGAVINATNTATGVAFQGVSIARININSTGFVPITGNLTPVPNNVFLAFNTQYPTANTLMHMVYDSTLGYFYMAKGEFVSGVPPEVFIDYCAAVSAHPHLVAPFLSIEPVSDFMTSWVTYAKNTYPWMKPRVEPPNETWNSAGEFYATQYAQCVSYALWGVSQDYDNAYGKWASTLGQAISAIYSNDRTKYSMICGLFTAQYSTSTPGASADARLKSTKYVAVNGGSAALNWVDRIATTLYTSSANVYQNAEVVSGFTYWVTNQGNATAQAATLNAYVALTSGNAGPPYPSFTTESGIVAATNAKTWAKGIGGTVAGSTIYEGGWGPDVASQDWQTPISAASQHNTCVLTLSGTTTDGNGNSRSGNPATIGMMLTIAGVAGMTQLNNTLQSTATFTNSSSTISMVNGLIVGQVVSFNSVGTFPTNYASAAPILAAPPNPLIAGIPYYVVAATGTTFQVSATKGGIAITITDTNLTAKVNSGWRVTAVSGNNVTIDVDSSAFGAYVSGGTATYDNSRTFSNFMRISSVSGTEMGNQNTIMYNQFATVAEVGWVAEFPSNFLYTGSGGSFFVLNPDIYAPLTPQWNSIVSYNA